MNQKIENLVNNQRQYFKLNMTLDYEYRYEALVRLKKTILKYESEIMLALKEDLNKSSTESYMTEIGIVLHEISFVLKHLKKWMKIKRVKTPLYMFSSKSYIINEPYGVTLIISPWNYPFQLTMMPLIAAISAGNCVVIKPSSQSKATSLIVQKVVSEVFIPEYCQVVLGDHQVSDELLKQRFDFIFFTGSPRVGKLVAQAASAHLTPICLELGGKSPCIIDKSADLKSSAKRIVFGKFLNSGQTCVAPDYIMVEEAVKNEFIEYLKHYIALFYNSPLENPNYPKIISKSHFDRLIKLLSDGNIVYGGKSINDQYLEPTIMDDVSLESKLMEEEIFGPILPIITFKDIEEVIDYLQNKEKPLALYLFTNSKKVKNLILKNISFGGGCINDTVMHLSNPYLPFGGIGNSGTGQYHGQYSFLLFSHQKGINEKSRYFDLSLRYPPYSEKKLKAVKRIIK